ncbi:MAG: hypothetical protein M3R36_19145 [Bacteroidota bacterium]|nr:hypothetical protein [Bacteroidota bacterium]
MTEAIKNFLSYNEIGSKWKRSEMNSEAARILTLKQVEAFEKIINDDSSWELMLSVFKNGRNVDAWLALDWPYGFDELLLCVPLCRLVDFECSRCTIGSRQENNSCAHDFSLFGYVAELLKTADRESLKKHIISIKKMLTDENYKWNMILLRIEN